MSPKDRYSDRHIDWNDTSYSAVREAERSEREDFERGGCDTEETLREEPEDLVEHIHIVYPEERYVSPELINTWYADALENGEISEEHRQAKDTDAKVRALDDAGIITAGSPRPSI